MKYIFKSSIFFIIVLFGGGEGSVLYKYYANPIFLPVILCVMHIFSALLNSGSTYFFNTDIFNILIFAWYNIDTIQIPNITYCPGLVLIGSLNQ